MSKITFTDKVDTINNPNPAINKVTADDLNEIKNSVNAVYDSALDPATSSPTADTFMKRSAEGATGVQALDLDLNGDDLSNPFKTGRIRWNNEDGCPEFDTEFTGSVTQVSREFLVKCRNATGSTIQDGSIVRVIGTASNRPSVLKAQADSADNAKGTLGFATHDIGNNSFGLVTTQGTVRGIDTSAFNEGDDIYLSATVAGGFTNVRPQFPNLGILIGLVLVSGVGNGEIFVRIDKDITQYVPVPTASTDPGEVGQRAYDANFVYEYTSSNEWIRYARSAF